VDVSRADEVFGTRRVDHHAVAVRVLLLRDPLDGVGKQ
jgi:hypothetical protein